ncbi:MAG: hypothetical protein RIC36_05060 [Rhodospirillales bacterium]
MCGVTETLMAAGTIMSAVGQYQQSQATADGYRRQSDFLSQKAAVDQERLRRKTRSDAARQRVRYATSGVQISGSPTEVQLNILKEGDLDARLVGWEARNRANSLQASASAASKAGENLLASSVVTTTGKLL